MSWNKKIIFTVPISIFFSFLRFSSWGSSSSLPTRSAPCHQRRRDGRNPSLPPPSPFHVPVSICPPARPLHAPTRGICRPALPCPAPPRRLAWPAFRRLPNSPARSELRGRPHGCCGPSGSLHPPLPLRREESGPPARQGLLIGLGICGAGRSPAIRM